MQDGLLVYGSFFKAPVANALASRMAPMEEVITILFTDETLEAASRMLIELSIAGRK